MAETKHSSFNFGDLSKGNDSGNPYNKKPVGKTKLAKNKNDTGPSKAKDVKFDLRKDHNPK